MQKALCLKFCLFAISALLMAGLDFMILIDTRSKQIPSSRPTKNDLELAVPTTQIHSTLQRGNQVLGPQRETCPRRWGNSRHRRRSSTPLTLKAPSPSLNSALPFLVLRLTQPTTWILSLIFWLFVLGRTEL